MIELHDYVQFYLVIILFFVLWFYVNILLDFGAFNTKMLPTDSIEKVYTHILARKIAHIGWLEVVWTIIPILILTAIAIPSFKLLYALDVVNSPLLTLRCIGNQWYWTYECEIVKPTASEIGDKVSTKIKNNLLQDEVTFLDSPYFIHPTFRYSLNNTVSFDLLQDDQAKATKLFLQQLDHVLAAASTDYKDYIEADGFVEFDLDFLKPLAYKVKPYMIPSDNIDFGKNTFFSELFDVQDSEFVDFSDYSINNHIVEAMDEYIANLLLKYTAEADSFGVDSYMLDADELQLGAFRLLEVDNYPQLPADAEIRLAITGTDVIHSFAVPCLGVKVDAIPGRLNQFGIRVRSPGIYYGQCSELCGVGHGFMPIKIQFIKVIK